MISSAKGILALLRETETAILQFGLQRLHQVVDVFWFEISPDIALIEELHESVNLPESTRQLAALVAAKVYFHLAEYSESVHFALAAGPLFQVGKRSLFSDTILSRCVDLYIASREVSADAATVDPRLEELFSNLAKQWLAEDESYVNVKELIGFALRARRLDILDIVLRKHIAATNSAEMLTFTFNTANTLVRNYHFRRELLGSLVALYSDGLKTVDYFSLAQCLLFLGESQRMGSILYNLLKAGQKSLAFQLAFDLFDYGSQEFLVGVATQLETLSSAQEQQGAAGVVDATFLEVLRGELTTSLYVKFLYARCNTDIHVLNQLKKGLDPKNSVTHNATVISNALMNCGTTIDGFLRDNMEWLSKANQWAKFTATATVGVLHKGHIKEAMTVLKPFLPDGSVGPLPFQEAGALYALGLIHAPVGHSASHKTTIEYLRGALRSYSASEQIVHGASLGLGLTAMGSHDEELFDSLFACVSGCDAVAGEGAALAIGLIMMGSGNQRMVEMLKRHAMEFDQKEKTIRGLSMAMGFMMLGREDDSLPLVEELLQHADPWVRLGAVYVLGLAFSGTGNAKAIERLLEIAVRDVSDDVRRHAVTMIGFLTFKDPALCVGMTRTLADSYNPHIRYGVAMALGIAGSGTADKHIIEMLWALKDDLTDFVRQGAFIALSLVLVQATEAQVPQVKEFRQIIAKKSGDRKEDTCTKFGCIVAAGILDAGGRNCTIVLHKQRHRLTKSVAGMFIFSQYWYWFPYTLMLSLSMHPTCFIGLNEALEMPKYSLRSNAPPTSFAIPKSVLQEKKEAKSAAQLQRVVLSTTKKEEQAREAKKRNSMAAEDFNSSKSVRTPTIADAPGSLPRASSTADNLHANEESTEHPPSALSAGDEPTYEILENPARVTLQQFSVISHTVDARYRPLKQGIAFGVCMLEDLDPTSTQDKELVSIDPNQRDDTAPLPEPFPWP